MCLEDIRLGRDLAPVAFVVPVVTGSVVTLFPADMNRTRISLSADGTGTLFVAPEGITPAVATGFALTPGEPRMEIDVERWGKLVAGRWQAFASAGTIQVSIMLATLEKR